jgi:hypothetical protein
MESAGQYVPAVLFLDDARAGVGTRVPYRGGLGFEFTYGSHGSRGDDKHLSRDPGIGRCPFEVAS